MSHPSDSTRETTTIPTHHGMTFLEHLMHRDKGFKRLHLIRQDRLHSKAGPERY